MAKRHVALTRFGENVRALREKRDGEECGVAASASKPTDADECPLAGARGYG